MNLPTDPPIKNIALLIAFLIVPVALAACGNKGPLVKPSDIPATTPAVVPAVAQPVENPVADPAPTATPEPASGTPATPH